MEFKRSIHVVIPHSSIKRKNMHIVEITCAMLNEKNLLDYFWVEVVTTIVYIMNQTPTVVFHGMTPKENS
jgi:hypothetical protein